MELFLLYLWLKLNVIISSLVVIAIISFIIMVVGFLANILEYADHSYDCENTKVGNATKRAWWNKQIDFYKWFFVLGLMLAVLLPTRQDASILVGGYVVQRAIENPTVQEIGNDTLTLIKGYLKDEVQKQLENTKEKAKEKSK